MASRAPRLSSGEDEKKLKRMISNRESARRSRMKKQKHMDDLVAEKAALERSIREISEQHDEVESKWRDLELKNSLLRAEKARWSACFDFLRSLAAARMSPERRCNAVS